MRARGLRACLGGGRIWEATVDTTIVRLLCVHAASLSGHILDRSYYIYIISTKPTSPLPSLPTLYSTTLSTSSLHSPSPYHNYGEDDDNDNDDDGDDDDEYRYTYLL
jgi:hypothetical protein